MKFIEDMHDGNPFKINVCIMLKFGARTNADASDKWEYDLTMNESILSLRLSNETYRGLFDILRVIRVNVPMEEFNKALVSITKRANGKHSFFLDISLETLI